MEGRSKFRTLGAQFCEHLEAGGEVSREVRTFVAVHLQTGFSLVRLCCRILYARSPFETCGRARFAFLGVCRMHTDICAL